MAKKQQDLRAARERKQKIFLAVGGVLFIALAAFQGPKLWKQLHPSAAAVAPAATATAAVPGTPGAATPGAPATTPAAAVTAAAHAPKSAKTQLAGIVIVTEQPAEAGEGQLASFNRFSPKDPFVQQVSTEAAAAAPATTTPTSTATSSPSTPSTPSSTSVPGETTQGTAVTPEAPVVPTMALLRVNGKLQRVDLSARFPSSDKTFVLRTLKPGVAKFGVAGGTFAGGKAMLTLRVGKKVTLVNTATGVHYVIRLLFVGSDADRVAGFSAK